MYINFNDSKEKFSKELTRFLDSVNDGVFYIGHASILVRLNKKKYIFDVIDNTNFYNNSWLFFQVKLMIKEYLMLMVSLFLIFMEIIMIQHS